VKGRSTITVLPVTAPAPTVHAFNSGRLYTTAGQRIAWTVLASGDVLICDLDRQIDGYVLAFPKDFAPTDRDVLHAYDLGGRMSWSDEVAALRPLLAAAARLVPAVRL